MAKKGLVIITSAILIECSLFFSYKLYYNYSYFGHSNPFYEYFVDDSLTYREFPTQDINDFVYQSIFGDIIYMVFVPRNLCYPCLDYLYKLLEESNVKKENIYFIVEMPNSVAEQDCLDRGFKNYIPNPNFNFTNLTISNGLFLIKKNASEDKLSYYIFRKRYDKRLLHLFLEV